MKVRETRNADRAQLEAAKDMSWQSIIDIGRSLVVPEALMGVVRSMHDIAFEGGRRFEMDRTHANWIDALGGFLDEEIDETATTEIER